MEVVESRSPFSPNTDADRRAMLDAVGAASIEELFKEIPAEYRDPSLDLPPPLSEFEVRQEIEEMARANMVPGDYACFLGAGSYRHFVPAVVRQIASRGEFMTSYTPYQPEVAQGTLQTTYEFQTLVCQLMGMEVANAGMYDGSTSLAEAALMAARITKFNRVAVLDTVSPAYREVLQTYMDAPGIDIDTVSSNGKLDLKEGTACLVVQQPNFFGYMEEMERLSATAHDQGALLVVYADPMATGMFRPPGDYGADIVAAEGQSLGTPPSFGGPYVGIFACQEKHMRQMPGRVVGKTVDSRGKTGYVLTLQTREQHIRRERATSNICTSVALVALTTTAYMAALGGRGIRSIAELCYHKAHYAASLISGIPGYSLPLDGTFFREFVVRCPLPPAQINERLLDYRIIGGLDVSSSIPNGMLVCATEMNSREEIEALARALAEIGGGS
jgi:glycine dehydrogenase subunit 1